MQKSKADLTQELGQQNIIVTSLDDSKPHKPGPLCKSVFFFFHISVYWYLYYSSC